MKVAQLRHAALGHGHLLVQPELPGEVAAVRLAGAMSPACDASASGSRRGRPRSGLGLPVESGRDLAEIELGVVLDAQNSPLS